MNLLSYSRIILTVIHRSKATWSYLLASHLTLGRYSLIVSLSLELDDDVISTDLWAVVLCNTSILILDTYVTIPESLRSRCTAVYRSCTKYCVMAQVSRVSTIPWTSYHLATCTLQACGAETNSKVAENHNYHSTTMSARAAVNKYNPVSYFCISAALLSHDCTARRHRRKQATVYVVTACHSTHDFYRTSVCWNLPSVRQICSSVCPSIRP